MRNETLQPDSPPPLAKQAGGMDGILVLYKPQGMTSHDAVNFVRGLTGIRRVGHTGTLDPMAEGVLPVCVGRATRLIEFMDGDRPVGDDDGGGGEDGFAESRRDPHAKAYECELRLGVTTDTLDIWGHAASRAEPAPAHDGMDPERVRSAFEPLVGDIGQIPPAYSAIKYKGKKLYEYARAGQEIPEDAVRPRMVRIEKIEVTDILFDADDPERSAARSRELRSADPAGAEVYDRGFATVRFSVVCSKGTYVRSIVRDVGDTLGCGAAMSALTRTKSGVFTLADAHTKEELERAAERGGLRDMALASDAALSFMPVVELSASDGGKFVNGTPVSASKIAVMGEGDAPRGDARIQTGRSVRVYRDESFLGIGVCADGMIKPRKVLSA
ncbi:MAG: tRNA pseudouridine(55) synthase TruB [Clostridiales Family XIII bacterium]|jgi:tRNA pseudouridine55 synthase|nr:tRNA pseudouridine(55) synthase TruB [Clostridiales Family XIII bacterium]